MFKVLESGGRKRRVWSPMTITVSVAAHAMVFGGVAYAATRPAPVERVSIVPIGQFPDLTPPPPPPAPAPEQPRAPQPHDRAPVTGQTIVIPAPTTVPKGIPAPDLTAAPLHPVEVTGIGKPGDVIGPVTPGDDRLPTGPTVVAPSDVVDEGLLDAGERPQLSNRGELVRLFERYYPPLMRDAGISGHTVVRCVVGTDGRVEPETIEVVEATNPAFADAARKAAEKFRFRPASMMGQPVRVLISIPIDWTLPR